MKVITTAKMKSTFVGVCVIAALSSCGHKEAKTEEVTNKTHSTTEKAISPAVMDTTQATAMSGGSNYTLIEFKHGSDQLTPASRQALKSLSIEGEHQSRAMDEVKVLAWADREYPTAKTKASKKELDLADRRADAIKKFMKDDLKLSVDIDKHNMAKRPGMFSEMIKTDDYKVKTNFEETGAAPTASNENHKRLMGSKVSKAVVFIKYK